MLSNFRTEFVLTDDKFNIEQSKISIIRLHKVLNTTLLIKYKSWFNHRAIFIIFSFFPYTNSTAECSEVTKKKKKIIMEQFVCVCVCLGKKKRVGKSWAILTAKSCQYFNELKQVQWSSGSRRRLYTAKIPSSNLGWIMFNSEF